MEQLAVRSAFSVDKFKADAIKFGNKIVNIITVLVNFYNFYEVISFCNSFTNYPYHFFFPITLFFFVNMPL